MGVLKEIRDRESEIDSIMVPIEEIYALLGRYQVRVPKEETETVSELRYGWSKMKVLAVQVTENLGRMQVGFKRELIKEVKVFVVDAVEFRADWDANGPAVPGLEPMEAVARLKKFTQMFEVAQAQVGQLQQRRGTVRVVRDAVPGARENGKRVGVTRPPVRPLSRPCSRRSTATRTSCGRKLSPTWTR